MTLDNAMFFVVIDGARVYIQRSCTLCHPQAVHDMLGTDSEHEFQTMLDNYDMSDWFGDSGDYLGPDVDGLEVDPGETQWNGRTTS